VEEELVVASIRLPRESTETCRYPAIQNREDHIGLLGELFEKKTEAEKRRAEAKEIKNQEALLNV
jgi:hypothetical protein